MIRAKVLNVVGADEALLGLGLSYGLTSGKTLEDMKQDPDLMKRLSNVAEGLARKPGGGHNKFLESITVWIDIQAPRYWWTEMDTYRVGVTKQSESTMHTITKHPITADNFEAGSVNAYVLKFLNVAIDLYKVSKEKEDHKAAEHWFRTIKNNLPEGFLQRRIVCLNLKALQNIYRQRVAHPLKEWRDLIRILESDEILGDYMRRYISE